MRIKYKVGDRIRCRHFGDGTVVLLLPNRHNIGIEFDNEMSGHDCHGYARYGHGWYKLINDIELLTKSTIHEENRLTFVWPPQ
jgi:hypothetical protein